MNTPPNDMLKAAQTVIQHAYAPYSNFSVAACVRADSHSLFVGVNVENAAFPMSTCAETGAISALLASGSKKIIEALILVPHQKICPPCGACRQRLLEFASPDISIHLCTVSGEYKHILLGQLLPYSFGPNNLESL